MSPSETLVLATYFFVLVILAVYGWHRYYLVYLYMKHKDARPEPAGPMGAFGHLTDEDALDLAHFLLSIPPASNMVPNDCEAPAGPPPE